MEHNKCTVFYEIWQMQCCGKPFAVGDRIKWVVTNDTEDILSAVNLGKIDYCYEAHTNKGRFWALQGKVERIFILYQKYEPEKNKPNFSVPVQGKLIEVHRVQDSEKDKDGMEACAFLVEISNFVTEPCRGIY